MTEKKGKTAKSRYHHGDLVETLLAAGLEVLKEKGPGDISLREVAKRAGVSHTAPYRHFASKHDLLAEMARKGFRQLAQAMKDSREAHPDDPKQQLMVAGEAYVAMAVGSPELVHLMFGGILDPEQLSMEFCEVAESAFEGLVRILENGQQAGLYCDKPLRDLAVIVWSQVHGLAMLISAGQLGDVRGDPDQQLYLTRLAGEILLSGIQKPSNHN